MLKSLAEVFGSWVSPKLTKVHFGVPGLQCIEEVVSEEGRAGSRKALSIPEGRITLTVGYNGRVAQQHLRVMEEVSGLSAALLARVHLLLPFTYGVQSSAYRREVEQVASRLGVGFTIFDDYMDCWEQARLALSTDIYINAQTTDMFSASMQEFLYAVGATFSHAQLTVRHSAMTLSITAQWSSRPPPSHTRTITARASTWTV